MPRPLSDDPERRRLQIFRLIYSQYHRWRSEVEANNIQFLCIEGEEIYFYDLLVGLEDLPVRQRQAFELRFLLQVSEREAAHHMGFTKWVNLVGQYSTSALKRMVESYDARNHEDHETAS